VRVDAAGDARGVGRGQMPVVDLETRSCALGEAVVVEQPDDERTVGICHVLGPPVVQDRCVTRLRR
jgi:hypothetical protein